MAQRPIFVATQDGRVLERIVDFEWHPGMAATQKRKSIRSLHKAAADSGIGPALEVSTKSESEVGQSLSALRLQIHLPDLGGLPIECAFQGSKVFEGGGPFTDLYSASPLDVKRDPRLGESGMLVGFELSGDTWPLEPKTAFYDWLYLQALAQNHVLSDQLPSFTAFTDIEFNPKKSVNTQARSCALYVALQRSRVDAEKLAKEKPRFLEKLARAYRSSGADQPALLDWPKVPYPRYDT